MTTKAVAAVEHGFLYRLFNNVIAPLFLISTTSFFVPFLWYTNYHLDGSYENLVQFFVEHGVVDAVKQVFLMPTQRTFAIIGAFAVFEAVLLVVVPGKTFIAGQSPSGFVPKYRANGVQCFLISMATLLGLHFSGLFNVASIYDELGRIYPTLVVSVFFLCWLLYLKGRFFPSHQSAHSTDYGSSGNIIMDYYWGMELYPFLGPLDLKRFFNCRFGMMAWPVLLTVYVLKQYELYGFVSNSMAVSYAVQMVYLTKFFIWETGYLNTIDIMHDRFGYYICWGVCCYVPSLYTLCTQYLVKKPIEVHPAYAALLLVAGIVCIYVQYDVDTQRTNFRTYFTKDHGFLIWGKQATYVTAHYTTTDGAKHTSLLLTSGWWGVSRHINYFFELLFTLLWVPPVQFDHVLPYSYLIFLTGLLLHRLIRDEERCAKKYGEAYVAYVKAVPNYILPRLW